MGSVRVAIVGVGNCAASLVQGVEYYRDADPSARVPGLMHVSSATTTCATSSSSPRSTSTPRRSAATCPRPSSPARTTPSRSPTCRRWTSPCSAATPSTASASTTARPSRSPTRPPVDVVQALRDARVDVLICYLPVGSEQAAKFYAQCAIDAKVGFVNALPGLHRRHAGVGREVPRRRASRSSATTSRARSARPSRTASWPSCSRTAASSWTAPTSSTSAATWTSRTCWSATACESKKISKTQAVTSNMEHDLGHPQRAHRPVRLRAVARRPQVGLRPPRGPRLRRRPAEPRVQARGLGQPQQRRRHHRRAALRQDRHGPRRGRPGAPGQHVLHEVPAEAGPRRHRRPRARGVDPRRGRPASTPPPRPRPPRSEP